MRLEAVIVGIMGLAAVTAYALTPAPKRREMRERRVAAWRARPGRETFRLLGWLVAYAAMIWVAVNTPPVLNVLLVLAIAFAAVWLLDRLR